MGNIHNMNEDLRTVLKGYEISFQRMMLDLDKKLAVFGVCIDHVEIDTRNFAKMRIEIYTKTAFR